MATFKLTIDEFDEVNYELIAIHTSLEDYHLAYFINQKFPILLSRNKNEIQVNTKGGETYFSRFTYENTDQEITWDLIQNKNEVTIQKTNPTKTLFSNDSQEIAARAYLLPEFNKVDYFLKIENPQTPAIEIIGAIKKIKSISTIYSVNASQIKSKNNLIF